MSVTIVVGYKILRNSSLFKIEKQLIIKGFRQIENGYSEVCCKGERYSVTKQLPGLLSLSKLVKGKMYNHFGNINISKVV